MKFLVLLGKVWWNKNFVEAQLQWLLFVACRARVLTRVDAVVVPFSRHQLMTQSTCNYRKSFRSNPRNRKAPPH